MTSFRKTDDGLCLNHLIRVWMPGSFTEQRGRGSEEIKLKRHLSCKNANVKCSLFYVFLTKSNKNFILHSSFFIIFMYLCSGIMNTPALITDPTWIFSVVLGIILLVPLLFRRLRVPPVIGLILAGILVGPYGFNLLAHDRSFELFGQVGIYYIMFLAGLELEMGTVEHYGHAGLRFGILTFSIPFLLGLASSLWLLHYSLATSLLLACIYASHTLVTYPIVGRYGLSRHRLTVVSVVATAFALFAALLVLAVVVQSSHQPPLQGEGKFFTFHSSLFILLLKCALYVGFAILVFPRVGRWFLRRYQDGVMQFIFILTVVFISASLAKMVGLTEVVITALMELWKELLQNL